MRRGEDGDREGSEPNRPRAAGEEADESTTVLVVDDDPDWLALATERLSTEYDVLTATTGEEALDVGTDAGVDVVLLDRRLPGISGEETLEAFREAGYGGIVVLVTNVEPEVEIVDWPFDDYVVKSETGGELGPVVERVLERSAFSDLAQERFVLASKKAALETRYDRETLEANADYRRLVDRLEELRDGITPAISELGGEQAFVAVLRDDDSRSQSSR